VVAASDALVAVRNQHGELELLDTEDGGPRRTFRTGPFPISHMEFAGPGRGTLVTLDFFRVRFWDVKGPASWPMHVMQFPHISFGPLAAHPDGTRVAAFTRGRAEVYDVPSGRRIERLEVSGLSWGDGAVYLNDGSLCLSDIPAEDRCRLCRWSPSTPPGFLATLFGRKPRRPGRERDVAPAALRATDGRRLLTIGIAQPGRGTPPTTLVDGATLTPIASFAPGRGLGPEVAAFAGGELLVGHGGILTAWPLREVFGVESHHDAICLTPRPDAAAARRTPRRGGGWPRLG
jgi:hypothetical protein